MARPRSRRPTDAETQILAVLWERGEGSVRDVWEAINHQRKSAYTSVATIMRIMLDKGLIRMTHERRPQRFAAIMTKPELASFVIDDLSRTLFDGSFEAMFKHAVTSSCKTAEQLAAVRAVVNEVHI